MNENKISDLIIKSYNAEKYNNLSVAIKNWNALLKEDIDKNLQATTHLNLAKLHNKQGNNDLSVEEIERAITANPDSYEAYFVLGFMQFEKQNFPQAIVNFEKSLKFNENDAGIYNNLANCFDRVEKFESAIFNYSKAVKLNPKYIASFYNRGNVYCKVKDYKNAIKDLTSAINLDENFYQAYYNRGQIYKLINENHLAKNDLKIAKQLAKADIESSAQVL